MSDDIKVHELKTPEVTDAPTDHPTKIVREGNRWRMVVELTWDVLPDDTRVKFVGDAPVDFANRALARVRPALSEITGVHKTFAHHHILERPTRCTEHD